MVQCRTPYSTGYRVRGSTRYGTIHTGLATYGYSVYRGHDTVHMGWIVYSTVHIHGTVPYIRHIRVHTGSPLG